MSRVAIVTDSTSCLPPELSQEYDIRFVPVGLVIDGKVYRDRIDITPAQFWSMFKDLKEIPTTATASPGDIAEVFTDLARTTDSLLCILVPRKQTATPESALKAVEAVKAKHPQLNIEIIDSKTSAGALGFVALEAARAAGKGRNLEEVAGVAEDLIQRVSYVAALETLKYLIKIGRAPKTALFGDLLGVKPLIGLVGGSGVVEAIGRVRGQEKSMAKLVDLVAKYADTGKPLHMMVHYSNSLENGQRLKEMVTDRYNCAEIYMSEYSPVMVTGTGPMLGLSFYS
jgi:DegV family protein with EDD domain